MDEKESIRKGLIQDVLGVEEGDHTGDEIREYWEDYPPFNEIRNEKIGNEVAALLNFLTVSADDTYDEMLDQLQGYDFTDGEDEDEDDEEE